MATAAEKKRIVVAFLERCIEYSDAMLEKYRARSQGATGMTQLEVQDQILHWTAYRAFNAYAIEEITGTTEIDDWFEDD